MMFGNHFLEAMPVLTCCLNIFLAAIGQDIEILCCHHTELWSVLFFFLLSLSCTLSYGNQIKMMKLLPTNCDLFSLLWWELTSQWWLGAVGTSCSCCTHLYVSGSAELGVLLGWHTGWWNVRFLIVIKFTNEKIMADVSFCQSWTESLKCDIMYYEQVSVNTIPVNMSKDWRT